MNHNPSNWDNLGKDETGFRIPFETRHSGQSRVQSNDRPLLRVLFDLRI